MKHSDHAKVFRALAEAILTTPGATQPSLRHSLEAYAASSTSAERAPAEVPQDLAPYVEKVTHHAFQVVDEDLDALKAAGYSEDALFEITLSTALGAAAGRLERGLAALRGSSPEEDPS